MGRLSIGGVVDVIELYCFSIYSVTIVLQHHKGKGLSNSTVTILQGGLVLDGLGNAPQQADVILRGSRIEAVLERSGASIGPTIDAGSATVIDVSGLTLMPGLIDAHCHISFDEPSSNDELFFHRTREGLAAIIAAQNVQKLLRAGVNWLFGCRLLV